MKNNWLYHILLLFIQLFGMCPIIKKGEKFIKYGCFFLCLSCFCVCARQPNTLEQNQGAPVGEGAAVVTSQPSSSKTTPPQVKPHALWL